MEFLKGKRTRNLFDPASDKPYKLSRSRLEFFVQCPRCFYIDRRLGIDRPSMPGWTLNSAVDDLLKKEFDLYRVEQKPHPIMLEYGLDAVPFAHDNMDDWRNNRTGVKYFDESRKLLLFGAVDDIWVTPSGELLVVDYKATSTSSEISLDAPYRQGYKRQLEIYQWLLRHNGLTVSDTGFIVYANGIKDCDRFDNRLSFTLQLIPYDGDDSWVDGLVERAWKCLCADDIPEADPNCEFCAYEWHRARIEENR